MGAIASQITSLTIVYSTVYSDADQRKHQKLRVTGLCTGNSPGIGEFPAQMASHTENVSIWWRRHVNIIFNEKFWISMRNSRKLVSKGSINSNSAEVQEMAWHRAGNIIWTNDVYWHIFTSRGLHA